MKKKNIGIIGNGKWAKIMTPKIAKFANVKFIANTKTGYKSFKLNNISWIFVLTNNESHYPIVRFFLNKKKNVFCEKPLTKNFTAVTKLINLSKKKNMKLYINDVENFKNKTFLIEQKNFILRQKKSLSSKESLLHRLAYHDFYLLSKYININDVKVKKYKESKNYLLVVFFTKNRFFKFIYDIKSKVQKHEINKTNMMKYQKDPLEKMIKYVFKCKKRDIIENCSNSLFASRLISIINKKFY